MSEQEKLNIIKTIRDEINMLKDYLEVKYATVEALQIAKDNRDKFCMVKEEKMDKRFKPIYAMLAIVILFLVGTHGTSLIGFILKLI